MTGVNENRALPSGVGSAVRVTLTVLLAVILGVLSFAAPLLAGAYGAVGDGTSLAKMSAAELESGDPDYYDTVIGDLKAELQRKMALVVITPEDLYEKLTDERLTEEARRALAVSLLRLSGAEAEEYAFSDAELLLHIEAVLSEYSAETGIEYAEGSADEVYRMVCDTVTRGLVPLPQALYSVASGVMPRLTAVLSLWYLPLIAYAVAAAVLMLINRRRLASGLYALSLGSYVGALILFVLVQILHSRDYLASTVLGDGPMMLTLRGIFNGMLSHIRTAAAIAVALAAVGFAVALVAGVIRRRRHSSGEGDTKSPAFPAF